MKTRKRLLSGLLALCLLLGLFAGTTIPALAADAAASVRVGGEWLSDGGENAAKTAKYQGGVLTLTGYNGGGILVSKGDLTIEVDGTNRIYEPGNWGVQIWGGTMIIRGKNDGTDKLTVHSSNSALNSSQSRIEVCNLAELNLSTSVGVNAIIYSINGNGLKFSDIGTVFMRGSTTYSGVYSSNPMEFDDIGTLAILNDGSYALYSSGGLRIKNCGTVLTYSGNKDGIFVYGPEATIQAKRLIAVGKEYGVHSYLCNKVDLQVDSMLLAGQSGGKYSNNDAIMTPADAQPIEGGAVPAGWKTLYYAENQESFKKATIEVASDTTKAYDGKPMAVTAAAKDGSDLITEQMTYLYLWYDANERPMMEAPTDFGTYKVKIFGFGDTYYSAFDAPMTTVTITSASKAAESKTGKIYKGYNSYDLPAIPEGMKYGTPAATELTNLGISNGKLSIQAGDLTAESYTVTIPVEQDTKKNYNGYEIKYTLTKAAHPQFDLCDGSTPTEGTVGTMPADPVVSDSGAWKDDLATAKEFAYEFAGWYTAPNGWGTKVTDAAQIVDNTAYYAHWVATRAFAGEVSDGKGAYVKLAEEDYRTVYTTGLDFTQTAALGKNITGDGYSWDKTEKTLTLDGLLVNAGADSSALILPEDTVCVELKADTRLNGATAYIGIDGSALTGTSLSLPLGAYNNICGGGEALPALEAKGNLFVMDESSSEACCTLYARGGAVSVMDDLALFGVWLAAPGIEAGGNADIEDAILQSGDMDAADPYAATKDILVVGKLTLTDSSVYAFGDCDADEIDFWNSELRITGGLYAEKTLSIVGADEGSFCDRIWCDGAATLSGGELAVRGTNEPLGAVYAQELLVKDGGRLTVENYFGAGIVADKMSVDNSTVIIRQNAGHGASAAILLENAESLKLTNARITAPQGAATKTTEDGNLIVALGGQIVAELTIEPYQAPVVPSTPSYVPAYSVTVTKTAHGTITAAPRSASSGVTITITATADGGYVLESLTATDASGKQLTLMPKADGKYTFSMPASAVTVSGTFRLRFPDLDPNAWYFGGAAYCLQNGLMDGVSETRFAPDGKVTRAQLVTMLWRLEQKPAVDFALSFVDVAADKWYTEAVRWAAAEKLVEGVSESAFAPDTPLTREQLVAILWRYAKYKGYDVSVGENTNILSYDDAFTVADYAAPAMQWACGAGILTGSAGKLLPKDSTSRAQIAVILQRFCEMKK